MGQDTWYSALFYALFRSLFGGTVWTLFMNTVHSKKKGAKIFKKFSCV